MMKITKREIFAIVVCVVMGAILYSIPQQTINEYEYFLLIFVLLPLGLLIATDKERMKNK